MEKEEPYCVLSYKLGIGAETFVVSCETFLPEERAREGQFPCIKHNGWSLRIPPSFQGHLATRSLSHTWSGVISSEIHLISLEHEITLCLSKSEPYLDQPELSFSHKSLAGLQGKTELFCSSVSISLIIYSRTCHIYFMFFCLNLICLSLNTPAKWRADPLL